MVDKLKELTTLLNNLTSKTIIASNQGKKLPAYPFFTYQVIDEDRDLISNIEREIFNVDEVRETKTKRIESIIQYDAYHDSISNVSELMRSLVDEIEFTYREDLIDNGFGIVNIGSITDNTALEEVKSRFRKTVEITIDWTEEVIRETTNMQAIEFKLDEDSEEIQRVERE